MHYRYAAKLDTSIDMRFLQQKSVGPTHPRQFTLRIPLLCIVGFSFYLGWIFCLFWSPSIFPAHTLTDFEIHAVRLIMTVAMFVAYVVFGLFARVFGSRRGEMALRLVALVCCPLGCIVGLFPQGLDIVLCGLLWSFSGIGSSALLLVWSKKIVELNRKQIIFSVSIAFFAASFLFIATAFMPADIAPLAIASIPVVSTVFAFLVNSASLSFSYRDGNREDEVGEHEHHVDKGECPPENLSDETGVEASRVEASRIRSAVSKASPSQKDERVPGESRRIVFMRTILLAFAYSIGIGFVGSCITVQSYYPDAVYVIVAGNTFAAVFTVLFLVRKPRNIAIVLTEVFLPIMLVCIFAFSVANYLGQLICIFVMLVLLACHDIVDIASLSKSSQLFDENYVKTFAVGRTLNGLGCTLGWAVGMVLNFFPHATSESRLFICFALVVFLVVTTSFAVFHPGPLSYFREVKIEAARAARQFVSDGERLGTLEAKSKQVAERYELTSRQEEVLLCLAQGRNASYIAQKFTISTHTAKSHIYNIYNKLNIHSQQELLDIIELEGAHLVETGEVKNTNGGAEMSSRIS